MVTTTHFRVRKPGLSSILLLEDSMILTKGTSLNLGMVTYKIAPIMGLNFRSLFRLLSEYAVHALPSINTKCNLCVLNWSSIQHILQHY